jgi:copper transport protein
MMNQPRAVLLSLLAIGWMVLGSAAPAAAHAVVLVTTPGPGALLEAAPERVTIEFNEPVRIGSDAVRVLDEAGRVVSGPVWAEGSVIGADLPPTARGWHAVSWRAVSADGHPVSGAWTFRIGDGADTPPDDLTRQAEATGATSGPVRWTWLTSQALATLGSVVLVGSLFLRGVIDAAIGRRTGVRLLVVGSGLLALVASVVAAAVNGPFVTGGGVLDTLFDGPASGAYLVRAVLVAGATVAGVGGGGGPGLFAAWALAAAGLVVPPVFAGHAVAEGAVARLTVGSHLLVGACWLGAVPALLVTLTVPGPSGWAVIDRFSRAAGRLLLATAALGAGAAFVLTGGPGSAASPWAELLLVKISLVAVAGAAGAWTRWRVLPAGAASGARPRVPLVLEAVAVVGVVVASVALAHNGPPAVTEAEPPVVEVPVDDGLRVQVVVDPGRVGTNWVHVYTLDETGLPVEVAGVGVAFAAPVHGIEAIPQRLSDVGGGHLIGITDDLGLAGEWQVEIDVPGTGGPPIVAAVTIVG